MATYDDIFTTRYTGDIRVDALLDADTLSWNYILPARTTLYYTFDTSLSSARATGVVAFNAAQKAAAQELLAYTTTVTGISFAQVSSAAAADFHFASADVTNPSFLGETKTSWNYLFDARETITSYTAEAFIYLDNVDYARTNSAPVAGSRSYEILLHEIGHALGLGHSFDTPYPLPAAQDNTDNTVMSYTHVGPRKTTFQEYDLLALRWIYGEDGLRGAAGYNSSNGPSLTPASLADDYAASSATTGVLAMNAAISASLESPGDRDWFAVSLTAGIRYVFELKGAATGNGTLGDPALWLLNSAGSTLASNDDASGSLNSRIDFTATTTGVHYLQAVSNAASGVGSYRLSVAGSTANRAPVVSPDSFSTPQDTALAGNVLANDSDPDGQAMTAAILSPPAHGTLVLQANGQFTYSPVAGFTGVDTFIYGASDGVLSGSATVSLAVVAIPELLGTASDDALLDTGGDARLSGLAGDDRLQGGSGNDQLDGGAGTDTAAFAQAAEAFRVSRSGAGWRVADQVGSEGVDTLIDVERLQFADKTFDLVKPAVAGIPAYGALDHFLFDPVYYLLESPSLVPVTTLATAWTHYAGSGAAQHQRPNSWFDAGYYATRWSDLGSLQLDDLSLFRHFNLFGVWEGRAPGPAFERFDPDAYLTANPDVAAYIDGHLPDFLGSRANGAIAHFILYGEAEGRVALDRAGQGISLDYVVDLIG